MTYDLLVIGGGIIGLSTAWQLQQRYPDKSILLLDKESQFARHQTGHNSGVIHAGVYYQPGSLKARFCKQGAESIIAFCTENNVPYQQCGKLLVATDQRELERMQALYQRCQENEIEAEILTKPQLNAREPAITGLGAILVGATGIVDYKQVCFAMARHFQGLGGQYKLNAEVVAISESDQGIIVSTATEKYACAYLISCAGLMADRLTLLHGLPTDFQIIPFRGEYYQLASQHNDLITHLIYPIPDPALPFLGVHLTRMIDGSITVGPNAVLGWQREGYGRFNFNPNDVYDMLRFKGFWQLIKKNLSSGLMEMKNSLWKRGYLKCVQKYCPQLELEDLLPCPAGIRAQAVLEDGSLVHDFLFKESPRSLHVCNAPSPAATSAIPIGHYICDKIAEKID